MYTEKILTTMELKVCDEEPFMYIFSLRIHPIYQISIKAAVTYNVVNIILYNFLRMDLVKRYLDV